MYKKIEIKPGAVLITGTSHGIGRATAIKFVHSGERVVGLCSQ